jgi:selenide,water dikinase
VKASSTAPVDKDIVLVGGGHAHVIVLRALGARPVPGTRITLVARDLETPYSGMLPGWVAGLYTREAIHIDLVRLAQACGARLIHAEALRIDPVGKRVELAGRPSIPYDLLSIDVGITPDLSTIQGAAEHAIAVKPIGGFIERWTSLLAAALSPGGPRRIGVVGGGAAGAELVMATAARLRADAEANGIDPASFSFALYSAGPLLPVLNGGVRRRVMRALKQRGIAIREHARVVRVTSNAIVLEDGTREPADAVLVSTHAQPPAVVRDSDLSKDPAGFVAVGPTLQTLDDPAIFAAGDCATMVASPREKAGVFAVRQGEPLAANLRRKAAGAPLGEFRPQHDFLTLIGTGDGDAVGGRGRILAVSGSWVWRWKHRIDTDWMAMMQDTAMLMPAPAHADPQAAAAMRCGGCAAKVGPGPLGRALGRLRLASAGGTTLGLDAPEDAAVIRTASGDELFETIDYFRAFVDDPWLFGRIAASHALNDIYAMGGKPTHALALAGIPHAAPDKVEEDLFQLLAGAAAVLEAEGVALSGGHSGESETLSLGFAVIGRPGDGPTLRKGGLRPGQALVLTKPIGTGIVFAAQMRADARAPWVEAALAGMLASNREPARILREQGATGATDVTGFGLAGHLAEMAQAAGLTIRLDLGAVPLLPGAATLARSGFASTLLPENRALEERLVPDAPLAPEALALLFDPQTAGGLLAGIPADRAQACVTRLKATGATAAAIIGEVLSEGQGRPGFIQLRNVAHWPP